MVILFLQDGANVHAGLSLKLCGNSDILSRGRMHVSFTSPWTCRLLNVGLRVSTTGSLPRLESDNRANIFPILPITFRLFVAGKIFELHYKAYILPLNLISSSSVNCVILINPLIHGVIHFSIY